MSSKFDEKRLKLAAQELRKTAIRLLQTADTLTAEIDDNLVDNNSLDINPQDLLNSNINGALRKIPGDALNNEGEALNEDQKTQHGVKKRTRKPRPPRDPNAPIKPQNAFTFYQKDVSSQFKAEHKGKPWSEISHLIGIRWKSLPKEKKEIYECQFEAAKKRFEVEHKAYIKSKESATGDNSHEENNNTSTITSSTPLSEDENEENEEYEEDTPNLSHISSLHVNSNEEINNTSNLTSATSPNEVKNEEDDTYLKVKSNAKNVPTSQTDPESSLKKKSKKRELHEDDDNGRVHEEEESLRKLKKNCSKEKSDEVQRREHKGLKKSSHHRHKKNRKNKKEKIIL